MNTKDAIEVRHRSRTIAVPIDEVLYLKAEHKYVTLRTAEHTYIHDESLAELEPRLGDRFIRVHRNALVSRTAVHALCPNGDDAVWSVHVGPVSEWLPVSRRMLPAVRAALAEGQA